MSKVLPCLQVNERKKSYYTIDRRGSKEVAFWTGVYLRMFVEVADREEKIKGIRKGSEVNILKGARPNGIWNWIIAI